jgi:trehalose 6-phosphate phosphatase
VDVLRRLTPLLRGIALISGRDTRDLAQWFPLQGIRLIGNHGLEEWHDGTGAPIPAVIPYVPALAQARRAIERLPQLRLPGVRLEVKLAILSVHFRNAADPLGVGRSLQDALEPIADEAGLTLHPARLVWEMRPPVKVDKGVALRRLRDELQPDGLIYIGDDVPDAVGFETLAAMLEVVTLAVGIRSPEVDPAVFSACDLVLDGQAEVPAFLQALLDWASPAA